MTPNPTPGTETAAPIAATIIEVLDTFHDGRREAKARAIVAAILPVLTSKDKENEYLTREWRNAYREYKAERARANRAEFLLAVMAACAEQAEIEYANDLNSLRDRALERTSRALSLSTEVEGLTEDIKAAHDLLTEEGVQFTDDEDPAILSVAGRIGLLIQEAESTANSLRDRALERTVRAQAAEAEVEGLRRALEGLAVELDRAATDRQAWADNPEIGGRKPRLQSHLRGKRYGYSHAAQLIRAALSSRGQEGLGSARDQSHTATAAPLASEQAGQQRPGAEQ